MWARMAVRAMGLWLHLMHITVISMFYTGLAAVVATYYSNSLWVNHCHACQGETESQEIDSKFPSSLSSSSIEGRTSTPLAITSSDVSISSIQMTLCIVTNSHKTMFLVHKLPSNRVTSVSTYSSKATTNNCKAIWARKSYSSESNGAVGGGQTLFIAHHRG